MVHRECLCTWSLCRTGGSGGMGRTQHLEGFAVRGNLKLNNKNDIAVTGVPGEGKKNSHSCIL